jgi:hypothetical protein
MLGLADVIVRHGRDYLARYGSAVPHGHVRALDSIARCRTGALGGHLAVCTACGREHVLPHSCHHRACPRCGHDATRRRLERQRDLLLPVPYFHVVPSCLRAKSELASSMSLRVVATASAAQPSCSSLPNEWRSAAWPRAQRGPRQQQRPSSAALGPSSTCHGVPAALAPKKNIKGMCASSVVSDRRR